MNTQQEAFVEDFWLDYDDGVIELVSTIFTIHGLSLIDEAILQENFEDTPEPQLDNDFGEYYWNGSRMVLKPGF